jgi:hypothetical protein
MRFDLDWFKLDNARTGLQIGYGVAILTLVVWISPEIKAAAQVLVTRFDTAAAFEVAGVKVSFTDTAIARGLELVQFPADGQRRERILKALHGLDSRQLIRLMTVAASSSSCEYANPEPRMRSDVALDYELASLHLAKIEPNPRALAEAEADMAVARAKGEAWTIGAPRACYKMTLDGIAMDVRSAIITNIAPAIGGVGPHVAPADGGPGNGPKVTAMK